jgi:hypothetical protein
MLLSMPSFIRNCYQWLGIDINSLLNQALSLLTSHCQHGLIVIFSGNIYMYIYCILNHDVK